MILILGKTLTFWTGILVGVFFILSFLGCRCFSRISQKLPGIIKHHNRIMKLTFVLFLVHAILGILYNFGVYV